MPAPNLSVQKAGHPFWYGIWWAVNRSNSYFYNNPCGLDQFDDESSSARRGWNFDQWYAWARNQSINPNVKVYIGAPASTSAAGTGHVNASRLVNIALQTQSAFTSFGGVMFWDMSEAYGELKSAVYKNIANPPDEISE
ncbi:hypothetical protein B0H13DRAFT_1864435 [Mycena leptocephala]|nr:hypothetical protein B0H13DRAFT_1864435 [Mycena leptocephala]